MKKDYLNERGENGGPQQKKKPFHFEIVFCYP